MTDGPILVRARDAWAPDLPDWVEELARQCDAASQNLVAKRMKRSATVVSQVLGRKYAGSYRAIEDVVRGHFMAGTVECPQLGTIPSSACRDWQRQPFINTNAQRVAMYRACRRCPLREAS